MQQWSKKLQNLLAFAVHDSSSGLSCQDGFSFIFFFCSFSWHISSKYLNHRRTTTLLYSCVYFIFFSLASHSLVSTLHIASLRLQAQLHIKRWWTAFNLAFGLFWGEENQIQKYLLGLNWTFFLSVFISLKKKQSRYWYFSLTSQ